MAYDKVIDSAQLDANLTAVADAIRTKGGTTGELEFPSGFVSAVEGIQAGGGGVSEQDILESFVTGNWPSGDIVIACNSIVAYAFKARTNITGVRGDNVTSIRNEAFRDCGKLATINFPALESMGTYCFAASAVTDVYLPSLLNGANYAFQNCKQLKKANLPSLTKMNGGSMFMGCIIFDTLILRSEVLVPMSYNNVFNNTPFASGGSGGTVYVPSALITQYQQAANWSALYAAGTCNFVAIEGSEYE